MNNPYYIQNAPSWGSQNVKGFGDAPDWREQYQSNQQGRQDIVQGVTSGLAAGAANSQPVSDFNIDQYAGFKGSGQGLASGGVIGAIIGGVTAQYGQFSKVNKNLNNLQTGVEGVTYDAYGRPSYAGGNITQAYGNLDELDKGISKLNKTHLDPATNVISSFTGTRRKMKRKRAALQQGVQKAQQDYNTSELDYRNQMLARSDYMDRINNNDRMYNLYKFSR